LWPGYEQSDNLLDQTLTKAENKTKATMNIHTQTNCKAFYSFGQAKFADGGWILSLSQFTQLLLLPLNITLNLKKVKKLNQK